MKLGEGGEAFFVFETEGVVPNDLITSPVISPSSSPSDSPKTPDSGGSVGLQEPEFLDISEGGSGGRVPSSPKSLGVLSRLVGSPSSTSPTNSPNAMVATIPHAITVPEDERRSWGNGGGRSAALNRSSSPPLTREQTLEKVKMLTQKLTGVNIPSKISDNGDIILDITGYKSGEEDEKHSDEFVRKILYEEFGLHSEGLEGLESIIGLDEEGNLRISQRDDEIGMSDSIRQSVMTHHFASDPNLSISGSGGAGGSLDSSNATTATTTTGATDASTHYVKTLRLTSDQLKSLNLHSGANEVSFTVNRAICTARIFYWSHKDPIVISDIDGTITKSDALGHVLTMLGRDWTHLGVGKLFTDIGNNGYNIMYLTARSVGQADTTRSYLKSVDQNSYKLPDGPVILSPDRTMAALRREVIMKKPEVFKMACLRDIQNLFGADAEETPFYAGFGNRITDALSYRSVGVPSSKIFTINANSEVHMELLELAGYKSSYVSITDLVDHFFPPVLLGSQSKTQQSYTDVNYWREPILDLSDLEEDEDISSALLKKSPLPVEAGLADESIASIDGEDEDDVDDEDYEDADDDDDDEDEEEVDEEDNEDDYTDSENEYDDSKDYDDQEDLDNSLLHSPASPTSPPPSSSSKLSDQTSFIKASEALQSLQL